MAFRIKSCGGGGVGEDRTRPAALAANRGQSDG